MRELREATEMAAKLDFSISGIRERMQDGYRIALEREHNNRVKVNVSCREMDERFISAEDLINASLKMSTMMSTDFLADVRAKLMWEYHEAEKRLKSLIDDGYKGHIEVQTQLGDAIRFEIVVDELPDWWQEALDGLNI